MCGSEFVVPAFEDGVDLQIIGAAYGKGNVCRASPR